MNVSILERATKEMYLGPSRPEAWSTKGRGVCPHPGSVSVPGHLGLVPHALLGPGHCPGLLAMKGFLWAGLSAETGTSWAYWDSWLPCKAHGGSHPGEITFL